MAELKPFCALRYDEHKVDIAKVIAPPYDVISNPYQEELYKRGEFNIVRLILGKQSASDTERDNRYTRARHCLEEWIQKGILKKEDTPSFYLYQQSYTHPEKRKRIDRTAFFALLRLEEFGKGVVFPHEKTHSSPKVDRFNLIKETKANLSPVFGLYDDDGHKVGTILEASAAGKPTYELTDDQGVHHKLWVISDDKQIARVSEAFRQKPIFIADGHHRYETALNYRRFLESEPAGKDLKNSSKYALAALVDFNDPGLLIFPTHRIIKQLPNFDKDKFIKALEEFFEVKKVPSGKIVPLLDKEPASSKVVGLYFGGKDGYILKLNNDKKLLDYAPPRRSLDWCKLDVSFISYLILAHLLKVSDDKIEDVLTYTRSSREAFETVSQGKALMSFLLRPISTDEVRKVCEQGELLPQKSTYFYPKLLSGLVIRKIEDKLTPPRLPTGRQAPAWGKN